jgi:hypothetical protein
MMPKKACITTKSILTMNVNTVSLGKEKAAIQSVAAFSL